MSEAAEQGANRQGGRRPGSGRKRTGRKKVFENMTISGTPNEIGRITILAIKSGKTRSRYVIDTLLKEVQDGRQGC